MIKSLAAGAQAGKSLGAELPEVTQFFFIIEDLVDRSGPNRFWWVEMNS